MHDVVRRGWWTVAVVSVTTFMAALDNLIVTVALPVIRTELDASLESLEWTVNAYTLAFGVSLIPAAALAERFGRRRFFLAGLALFTLASAWAGLASSPATLVAARLVQGVGGAVVTPLSLTLIAHQVPRERRGPALGTWSAATALGIALGPLVGGAVADTAGWHWIFWINVPVGLALLPIAAVVLLPSRGAREPVDLVGFALVTSGLFGVVFGLVRSNASGWGSPLIVGSLSVGVVLLTAFVLWESRAATPMVPLRFFTRRRFVVTNVVGFLMSFGVFGSVFLLTQLLQSLFDFGPFDAGLRMLFWSGATTLVSPVAASLAERFGPRPFMAAGLGLLAVAFVWIAVTASVGMSWVGLIPPFVLGGIGNSLAFAPAASAVLAAVATEDAGRASGVNNAIREVGGAFGVAVLATVFAHHGGFASVQDILDGTRPAVLVGAAFVAVGAVAALFYGSVRPAVRRPEAEQVTREPSLV